ncbi:MAG: diguanylate cyclase [Pseudobutyrivibrio sp.]|nr:diguanylate cyclase [Pseudobutyrivibrio sp.]
MTEKKILKNSLRTQMLRMTVVPLTMMVIIIIVTSIFTVYESLVSQVQQELEKDANLALLIYDQVYTGDFSFEEDEDGNIVIYKGDKALSGDESLLESLAGMLDIDISLFYDNVRVLTTLEDAAGNRAIGTTASVIVKNNVLEKGQDAFYESVMVYDVKSFAYYMPLKSDNGEVYGMIAVARPSADVRRMAISRINPIVIISILASLSMGFLMVRYNRRLGDKISKMDKFMRTLADGEFDAEMPRDIMENDDELRRLGNEGKRMARSIKKLVDFDALTDLNNRRSGDKRLAEMKDRAQINGVKFCVSIGDIDFFKKVNDTYGHEKGDEVLKAVAERLKLGMVSRGFVARWGGEEFLLIFENMEIEQAKSCLEEILYEIRKIHISGTDRNVTMSFGITSFDPEEETDSVLKRADDNLYTAKGSGRNRIVAD